MNKARVVLHSTLFRYGIAGGASYIIEIIALAALTYIAKVSPLVAVAISFWIGFAVAFLLQKFFTYKSDNRQSRIITKQLLLYSLLVLFNYTFTLLLVAMASGILGVLISRTLALIITTVWNYFLYREVIFRSKN